MFDESSDVQMRSLMNVFVNVLFKSGKFKTLTLTLSELEASDSNTVYHKLLEVLEASNVDLNSITGICSDGCSVMLGKWKGVCTMLRRAVQKKREAVRAKIMALDRSRDLRSFHPALGIFVVHCVCHRFALILHDAIKGEYIEPDYIELLQRLYTYFSRSPRRKLALRKIVKASNDQRREANEAAAMNLPDPDDEMHAVFKALVEKHRLPLRIVLTRWLCCREANHVLIVGRDSYCVYFAEEAARMQGVPEAKAPMISEWLQDNILIAWAYFLEDVIPILTNMNILFQSSLPLPHLLFDKVESAKRALCLICGQTPVDKPMEPKDVTHSTIFGAFAENFLWRNSNGRVASHGSTLLPSDIKGLKQKWATCLWYMHNELDERFPGDSMEVFELLKVVDPEISHSALRYTKVGGVLKIEAVKKLLHIFELPLHEVLNPASVQNSFTNYLSSTIAHDTFQALYVYEEENPPDPIVMYKFYAQLLHHKEMRDWALFALFLALFPTGNAISERGFSALNATNTKDRYSLSVKQAFHTMIISFNGPSYEAFKKALDDESLKNGKDWWGFVPPTNFTRQHSREK